MSAYPALGRVAEAAPETTAARAIAHLARADDEAAVEAIDGVFATDRVELHVAAVIALLNMNQPAAHAAVERVYNSHGDPRVRRAIERLRGGAH